MKIIKNKLATSQLAFTVFASFFVFLLYTIMYAYRKPFSAETYTGDLWGVDVKILFVLAQIFGYCISKFIGTRFLSALDMERYREFSILLFIGIAWLGLLGFAVLPLKYKIISMVVNGLPLGLIWGLVFSYVEGREFSEILNVGLSATFIVSSGLVKSLGLFLSEALNVTAYWMPFVTGAVCYPFLIFSVWMLTWIPAPSDGDIALRTKREPMTKAQQNSFFKSYWFGISLLVVFHAAMTVFREMRDSFAADYWLEKGVKDIMIFTRTEVPISILVLSMMFFIVFIKNNTKAIKVIYFVSISGCLVIASSTFLYSAGLISPLNWMIYVGLGLYMGYVPFTFLIERLIASLNVVSTAIFIVYIADAFGYFGSAVVFFIKNFSNVSVSWDNMLTVTAYSVAVVAFTAMVTTCIYFKNQIEEISKNDKA